MFDTTPTFLKQKARPGLGGWAERHAWKILIFAVIIRFALVLTSNFFEVGLIYIVGETVGVAGIVLFITGLVLRRRTGKATE